MTRKTAKSYRSTSKRYAIATLIEAGLTRRETFAELTPLVTAQRKPMIFSRNLNGSRVVLPLAEQYQRLWFEIGRVIHELTGTKESEEPMPAVETPSESLTPVATPEIEESEEEAAEEIIEAAEEAIEEAAAIGKESPEEYYLRRIEELRAFCARLAEIGEPLDEISNRPMLDGLRAVWEGVDPDVILSNVCMAWEDDTRASAGIKPVDVVAESRRLARVYDLPKTGLHKMAGLVVALIRANVPVYLGGPAGSGKSFLARQAAELANDVGLTYAECPLTAGATPSWLLGNISMQGFMSRPFLSILSEGGIFTFEEIDAADPNMLLVANNAIALRAGECFFNPVNGEQYERHPHTRFVATANTWGLGATRDFTGRDRLDGATIDRFRVGRVFVEIDAELARWAALNQDRPTLD